MNNISSVSLFRKAREVATPLIAVQTSDANATIFALSGTCGTVQPLIEWNMLQGFIPLNKAGRAAVEAIQSPDMPHSRADDALLAATKFPAETCIFFHSADALLRGNDLNTAIVAQGFWNLRDAYKNDGRTAVLLGSTFTLPAILESDVLLIDEALPDADKLRDIVQETICNTQKNLPNYPIPTQEQLDNAVDAIRGLPAFSAEQATVLSLEIGGLNVSQMWQRKREKIKQCPGLSVYDGEETFDTIGGYDGLKRYFKKLFAGKAAPKVVVFVDEIEKAMAGATAGDTSGVSQEMHGTLLSWMSERQAIGNLFLGAPGTAKSVTAKALGNEAGVLTIVFDLSAMKEGLVGASNANLRRALKVIDAVSDGSPIVIATCNSVQSLSPELLRRFEFGTYFFELPNAEERLEIWKIHAKAFDIELDMTGVDDTDWTGAEIHKCCKFAYALGVSLSEAAKRVIPFAKSKKEVLSRLRSEADGNYLSATTDAPYHYEEPSLPGDGISPKIRRSINLGN